MALDELLRDDASLLEVKLVNYPDDAELCEIFNELKENTTIRRVEIESREENPGLGVKPSLALAAAISKHPAIEELYISEVESMSSFGAIAVAIQQSKTLTFLYLNEFTFSLSQMGGLEWLLAENGLERLTIEHCYAEGDVFCIANGIESNQSLKELHIESWDPEEYNVNQWTVSVETLEAIPRFIERSTSIELIYLEHVTVPPEVIAQIAGASSEHRSLTKIFLCAVGRAGAVAFPRLLEADSGVETLDLSSNDLSDTDGLALSSALRHNTSLKRLDLGYNRIGPQGAAALANALYDNSALKVLHMHDNPIGDAGAATLARALTRNTTLTFLGISHFSEPGLNAFSSCLPSMNGLKRLYLGNIGGLSSQNTSQFLDALKRNSELEDLYFFKKWDGSDTDRLIDEIEPKMELQMTLNRAGKRILKSESEHVPDSLWPLILARSSNNPDALYFFLREKPDALINKTPVPAVSRKRKRD